MERQETGGALAPTARALDELDDDALRGVIARAQGLLLERSGSLAVEIVERVEGDLLAAYRVLAPSTHAPGLEERRTHDVAVRRALRQQQTRLLFKATIEGQEEERERICLDIHDSVCQTLSAAHHYLEAVDGEAELLENVRGYLRRAVALVRKAGDEAREIVADLRPVTLDMLGLTSTLRHELVELNARPNLSVSCAADLPRLPKDIEIALYRILHEAINNAIKHAEAECLVVRLRQIRGHVVAVVRDDGRGFDYNPMSDPAHGEGVGLLSMRKRAELLCGRLDVRSRPGHGTRVRVVVPLDARAHADFDL